MQPTIECVYDIYRTYLDRSSNEFETVYLSTVSTREAAEDLVIKFFLRYMQATILPNMRSRRCGGNILENDVDTLI
jgi:hypothetical protein